MTSRLFVLSLICSLCGCSWNKETDKEIESCAVGFATSFYSFNFAKASKYCLPEEIKYLSFYVSGIREEDLDSLSEEEELPDISVQDISYEENHEDSIAIATCEIRDAYILKEIGRKASKRELQTISIPLVKRNGRWYIRMEALQQNEK